jgi:ribosomal protein L18E
MTDYLVILEKINYFIRSQDFVGLNGQLAMLDTEHIKPEELVAWVRFSAPARQKLDHWESLRKDTCRIARHYDNEHILVGLDD